MGAPQIRLRLSNLWRQPGKADRASAGPTAALPAPPALPCPGTKTDDFICGTQLLSAARPPWDRSGEGAWRQELACALVTLAQAGALWSVSRSLQITGGLFWGFLLPTRGHLSQLGPQAPLS